MSEEPLYESRRDRAARRQREDAKFIGQALVIGALITAFFMALQ